MPKEKGGKCCKKKICCSSTLECRATAELCLKVEDELLVADGQIEELINDEEAKEEGNVE